MGLFASTLKESQINFALEVFRRVAKAEANAFYSPMSVSAALAMVYAGAGGETAKELKAAMFPDVEDPEILATFAELMGFLNEMHSMYTLDVANRLYCHPTYPVLDAYKEVLTKNFRSEIISTDFTAAAAAVAAEINTWVGEKTCGKIVNLISPTVLTPLTRLVLINAIYFKGDWKKKFDAKLTKKETFHVTPTRELQVDMMWQRGGFLYAENPQCQLLGMSYKGDDLVMFIFLPKERNGLLKLEANLNADTIFDLTKAAQMDDVEVTLPKFKVEQSFELTNTLQQVGIKELFQGGKANLSKITNLKDLFVGAVVHKAFIEVNEEGTEAAAATGVISYCLSGEMNPPRPLKFTADHPFLFLIMDQKHSSILFMGHTADPTLN